MKRKALTSQCPANGFVGFKTASVAIALVVGLAVDVAAPLYGRDVVAEGRRLGLRPTYKGCLDASGGVIPDMRDCISEEMGYQDERLNRVYKQVMAKLDPTAKRALRDEERAWILQRDIDCDPGPEPGQGMELDAYGCAVRSTASRARELEQMLQK